MIDFLKYVEEHKKEFINFITVLSKQNKKLLVVGEIINLYKSFKISREGISEDFEEIVSLLQEVVIHNSLIYIDARIKIGYSQFYLVNTNEQIIEQITIIEYLKSKERFVNPDIDDDFLTLNFKPFYDNYPSVRDEKSIGAGVDYLNKFLSSKMFNDIEKWKEVLLNFINIKANT